MDGKTIITIFTGGTIGSRKTDSGDIAPDEEMSYRLLSEYRQYEKKHELERVNFVPVEPYFILSEHLTGKELLLLAECVNRYLPIEEQRQFQSSVEQEIGEEHKILADGIIIMHGTDTLQYSAALLELFFGNSSIPILLVSSAYPLEDSRANGLQNFCSAVAFISGNHGSGVFVSYANSGDLVKIHQGSKLVRSLEYSADVFSISNRFYGLFTKEGQFVKNPSFVKDDEYLTDEQIFSQKKENISLTQGIDLTENCEGVLRLEPFVGMQYPEIGEKIKVILMGSYHSGTIGISDGLKQFTKQAIQRKIPIYLTGLNSEDADYETVKEYQSLGIIPLRDKTGISQYMKFWLLLSNQ